MNNWENTTLDDLIQKGKGLIQTGPFGSQLHASDYVKEGIPCLMPVNLKNNKIDLSNVSFISDVDAKRLSKHLVKKGDIIYSRRGDITQKGLVSSEEEGCFCGTGCLLVRPGKNLNSNFLHYFLSRPASKSWIINNAVGITMPNLNTKILGSFPIKYPSIEVQNTLATVLANLDSKIDINNKINTELDGFTKFVYNYWFVQFDFPDKNGNPYKTSGGKMVWNEDLKREIPEGWEVKSLGNIESNIITGRTPATSNEDYFGGSIPFICIGDVRGNMHIINTEITLTQQGAETQNNKFIPKGAICVTCIASPGLVGFATRDSQTNQQLNSIVCQESDNRYYLYFYLTDYFKYSSAKTGNTFANMNKSDFSSIQVLKPKKEILTHFSNSLESTIEKILNNSIENQQLSNLRDWLLPMLMNGQVSVGKAYEQVDEVLGMVEENEIDYKKDLKEKV